MNSAVTPRSRTAFRVCEATALRFRWPRRAATRCSMACAEDPWRDRVRSSGPVCGFVVMDRVDRSQVSGGLFRRQVALGLGQHFVADHEFAHAR